MSLYVIVYSSFFDRRLADFGRAIAAVFVPAAAAVVVVAVVVVVVDDDDDDEEEEEVEEEAVDFVVDISVLRFDCVTASSCSSSSLSISMAK